MFFLTPEDHEKLLKAFAKRRGNRPLLEEEVTLLEQWAEDVRLNQSFLEGVLDGTMTIDAAGGEPKFSLTVEGHDHIENTPRLKKAVEDLKKSGMQPPDAPQHGKVETQVMLLLAIVNARFPTTAPEQVKVISKVCGISEEATKLALHSLKSKGLVDQGESGGE